MSLGNPVLISGSNEISTKSIRQIAFSRQDQASFDETLLQQIVDQSPEVLPIGDFYPTTTSVCSLGREIPLPLGERQGFIDNLLVTNEGRLVIVETKLYRNPEAIRDVIIQILEYGIAVQKIGLNELESRIARGDKNGKRLTENETIRSRAASMPGYSDDFEIALEHYQRTGEILLLLVADGIRDSVERITKWMNKHGSSSPIKFGLVELQFFELSDGARLVFPKTLLRTIDVSRHVIVVDIQNKTNVVASAVIGDEPRVGPTNTRVVKSASPPMTQELLMGQINSSSRPIAEQLLDQLESIGFDENTKQGGSLRFGISYPEVGGEFMPMLYLSGGGINAYFPKRLTGLLGPEALTEFRTRLSKVAPFWSTEKQMLDPYSNGSIVRYEQIKDHMNELINILEEFKVRAINALEAEES